MERRLAKELEKVREKFDAECVNDSLLTWQVAILGPDDSPYFGGTFLVELRFPNDYPFRAPDITFQTRIYHPNINHKGEVCLGISGSWMPSQSALTILECLLGLLKEPNANDPLVPEIAAVLRNSTKDFQNKAEEWTHKYAM